MNIYFLGIVILFNFVSAHQDQFLKGNHLFEKQDYVQACQAYQAVEHKDFALWYNLALCFLYQHDQAHALVAIKRAERQASFEQLTKLYALNQYIQRQENPDFIDSLPSQLAIFSKKCILSISILFLQFLILILLGSIIIIWYRRWYHKYFKIMVCLVVALSMVSGLFVYKIFILEQQIGIVTKDGPFLYAGPDESFYKKSQLQCCDQVTVLQKHQKYYQVTTGKIIGWVSDNNIELV